jgi:hypothetical protein
LNCVPKRFLICPLSTLYRRGQAGLHYRFTKAYTFSSCWVVADPSYQFLFSKMKSHHTWSQWRCHNLHKFINSKYLLGKLL